MKDKGTGSSTLARIFDLFIKKILFIAFNILHVKKNQVSTNHILDSNKF